MTITLYYLFLFVVYVMSYVGISRKGTYTILLKAQNDFSRSVYDVKQSCVLTCGVVMSHVLKWKDLLCLKIVYYKHKK